MGVFDNDFDKADHMGEIRKRPDPLAAAHRVLERIEERRTPHVETSEEATVRQAEFRRTTVCGKHIWDHATDTCRKCGARAVNAAMR